MTRIRAKAWQFAIKIFISDGSIISRFYSPDRSLSSSSEDYPEMLLQVAQTLFDKTTKKVQTITWTKAITAAIVCN